MLEEAKLKVKLLRSHGYTLEKIANGAGVTLPWLKWFVADKPKDPGVSKLVSLIKYADREIKKIERRRKKSEKNG